MKARLFLQLFLALVFLGIRAGTATAEPATKPAERPNVVVIFCDDLGYGDLGVYGHPTIRTPNIDRMAAEGMRFTDFYTAAAVCTPSRAALLTGRLPARVGVNDLADHRVFFPGEDAGLDPAEVTVAELLRGAGYATACVGKWHLGDRHPYLPTDQGFDRYFGIPYSNDMGPLVEAAGGGRFPDVPLMRGDETIERPARQHTLTRRYTEEARQFIRDNAGRPFFLYLAHTMPHTPLHASEAFRGTSARGPYGDVVAELDWSTGVILDTLREQGVAGHTLVLFTSDNEPWLIRGLDGGSAGLLRGGKGSTWEGGVRVPAIAWWPGTIPAGAVTSEPAATLDLLPTAARLAGVDLPAGHTSDGFDLVPLLTAQADEGPRDAVFTYRNAELFAARVGRWKAHYVTQAGYGKEPPMRHDPPLLFDLYADPSESWSVAAQHPDVLRRIADRVAAHRASLEE